MAELAQKPMTVAEFLDWDDGTDTRYELVFGQPVAMAPASGAHGMIVGNLVGEIRNQLRPPCRVVVEAGILLPDRADVYFQADLAVTCRRHEAGERAPPDPVLIVEVLSRSTTTHDRTVKLDGYRRIPSVQEILFVSTDERWVELWRRHPDHWLVETLTGEATIRLESIHTDIDMAEVYRAVAF